MKSASEMTTVAVLGAGTMGAGIAQVCAGAGMTVRLQDVTKDHASRGKQRIADALEGLVTRGKMDAASRTLLLDRITPSGDIAQSVREADLVIEAAPEDVALKREMFRTVSEAARWDAVLATNTSSLSVTSLAEGVHAPDRFVGLHFFNPPPVMKLLEIVRGEATSAACIATCRALAARLGKDPIVVRDSPGFASSRLGLVLGLEAMRMVEEGVASAGDIDRAMELGYRHPMGPLKLTDLVGLDVRLAIADHLAHELDDRRFAPPDILRRLVADGHLGKKTGRGFHRWENGETVAE